MVWQSSLSRNRKYTHSRVVCLRIVMFLLAFASMFLNNQSLLAIPNGPKCVVAPPPVLDKLHLLTLLCRVRRNLPGSRRSCSTLVWFFTSHVPHTGSRVDRTGRHHLQRNHRLSSGRRLHATVAGDLSDVRSGRVGLPLSTRPGKVIDLLFNAVFTV